MKLHGFDIVLNAYTLSNFVRGTLNMFYIKSKIRKMAEVSLFISKRRKRLELSH